MSELFDLVSRKHKLQDSCIRVQNTDIGGKHIVVMAGPCTVENKQSLMKTAAAVKTAGVAVLRGGAFKIRTSPYSFQGLGEEGLRLLEEVKKSLDIPVVTEIVNPSDVDLVSRYADILQIGSRNMQNTALLKAVGKCRHPVLLKRGFSNTVVEWLAAAEYIMVEGNQQVILCERGIRTFEDSTRFSLDILSIPVIKKLSHLPIIVDPSHAAGDRSLVAAVARAAIAAGADGLLIEVSSNADEALVDGAQTLTTEQFAGLMHQLRAVARSVDREL